MPDQRPSWHGLLWVLTRTWSARRTADPGQALRSIARGGDRVVAIRVRGQGVLLLLDPDLGPQLLAEHAADTVKGPGTQLTRPLLGDGLLTSEGDAHRRARRLVAPAFSPRRIAGYAATFDDCTRAHTARWSDGAQLDMHREMAALTLDIVGRTLLGVDLAVDVPEIRRGLEVALNRFADSGFALPGLRRRALELPSPEGIAEVHGVVDTIIARRRDTSTEDRGDVVSALLAAGAAPDGLTAGEIHDHVITLLMAGHETTANALSWTLYLLGQHPDIQDQLYAELSRVSGPELPYTRAVISESMRLFPPAWLLGRTTTAEFEIAGRVAPPGSIVAISPLLLHHDERWFPDAERFDPGRWMDGRAEQVPRNAYLPFGTGPRACIGEQFAWAEAIAVLAGLARGWQFHTDAPVTPQYRVTMRPSGRMPITVRRRPTAPAHS